MSESRDADRPAEQPAVKTTIVGGRPPGSGKGVGDVPRGIEVLVKKASVDREFRALLLERRSGAAGEIGLTLEPAEATMLDAVPAGQLEAVIARTEVSPDRRRAFLGTAATVMLAALGTASCQCNERVPVTDGIRPEPPPAEALAQPKKQPSTADEAKQEKPPAPAVIAGLTTDQIQGVEPRQKKPPAPVPVAGMTIDQIQGVKPKRETGKNEPPAPIAVFGMRIDATQGVEPKQKGKEQDDDR